MLLNIEKSREQDKERSEEWLVNTDPGVYAAYLIVYGIKMPINSVDNISAM